MLEELIERTSAVNPFLKIVGILCEELLCFLPGFLLLDLHLHHGLLVASIRAMMRVLQSTSHQKNSVDLWIVCLAVLKCDLDFTRARECIVDENVVGVELTVTHLQIDKLVTWQKLLASGDKWVHVLEDGHVADSDVEDLHARLPEVALGELEHERVLTIDLIRQWNKVAELL